MAKMELKVKFENKHFDRVLTDLEIEKKLSEGAIISHTAMSIYHARKRGVPPIPHKPAEPTRHKRAPRPSAPTNAVEVSDPSFDRSDESAIAVNPNNPNNIVAGAVTFDGKQFNNSAYVTIDAGGTWKTVTALADVDEGAGIAFDDSCNCYYTSMQGGFNPVCVVSRDGGSTWSPPARFGYGDKTAVAARGQVALCGFDRVNTEACAFTLDGGANWTVHDFTDAGIGTGPLVSYDQRSFYIIYAALDNNLKIYVSADRGQTWTGPRVIVAGNAPQSTIAGPLSYEGGALTSPGTNVTIDAAGRLHVLYIDSNRRVPMYTSSSDQGSTWSTPVNVNPERSSDVHMWPCLSCDRAGNLQGGSVVFDQALNEYRILRHAKPQGAAWSTSEADNGPWAAAGPSPDFRIGFGDYFDCDSPPRPGLTAMAWSETADGAQPWRTWARVYADVRDMDVLVHLQDIGDRTYHMDEFAGTRGESRRLEGFQLTFEPPVPGLSMRYMAHLQDIGDVPFVNEGQFVGTRGQSRRLEGFAIELTGPNANDYDVSYMAHLQDIADTPFARNGEFCGTRGQSRRVEGMRLRVTPKNLCAVRFNGLVHLQDMGDEVFHENDFAGTRGQSRRLEGFQLKLDPPVAGLSLQYMAHLQDIGDTPWLNEGEFVGTRGQSRRLEGFAIRLTGPNAAEYGVSYMAHLEGTGDTRVFRNGEFCGTRGESRRVEGMLIQITRV